MIIDEGHRIKNRESKLFRELKGFSSGNRLLLTGTPIQVRHTSRLQSNLAATFGVRLPCCCLPARLQNT